MKKILCLTCFVLALSPAAYVFAADAEIRSTGYPTSTGYPVKIDGVLDIVWPSAVQYQVANAVQGAGSKTDGSASWLALWDPTYFYVFVEVNDLKLYHDGSAPYHDDSVEVFMDIGNKKPTTYTTGEQYQYRFNWDAQTPVATEEHGGSTTGVDFAIVTTDTGYALEVRFPWTLLYNNKGRGRPELGDLMGFEIQINDDDDGADRDNQYDWYTTTNDTWNNPSKMGTVEFTQGGPPVNASAPKPSNNATNVLIDTLLAWIPGMYAATHDVYLGTDYNDVNDATATSPLLVSTGQAATTYTPTSPLAFGQTYYWRVDEVNAPGNSGFYKGIPWSFTTETYGFKIDYPTHLVKATASSQSNVLTGPDKTIDGSGLTGDQHSTSSTQMWLSKSKQTPVWIQYEFDQVYNLYQMWVWNQNQISEPDNGVGAMDVTVETSTDGTTWTALANVPQFADAPGEDTYVHNTTVDFGGASAKFVKLNILSNWGGAKSSGLAEVRFFYIPVKAFGPTPVVGAEDVAIDKVLNWRSGRKAASHEVYLGTDPNALSKVATVTEHSYSLASAGLEYGRTYYWKIDEVNDAATPSSWPGDVWSFTAIGYRVVEDFESYNDLCNRIFWTWVDRYGYTPTPGCEEAGAGAPGNGSNAAVGNDTAPYADKTNKMSGGQSLPLFFDNTMSPYYSETYREWATPQSWTDNGANTLRVYLRGDAPSFIETSPGTIIMNGTGTDIWDVSDQFRYVYKQLSGNGSIVARVDLVGNTDVWAKAGVMIRETLETGSIHQTCVVTPGSGVSFQHRDTTDSTSLSATQSGLVAPYWVKITRNGNSFTAQCSVDGVTWTSVGTDAAASGATVTMANNVYIGLAVTSHTATAVSGAKFSNVSTTGGVSGSWQVAEIGAAQVEGNKPETCYVVVQDSGGKAKIVNSLDPTWIATGDWIEWNIPLSQFTSAGVNLKSVKKLIIGVGDKNAPKLGGKGKLNVDAIRLTRMAP